MTAPIGLTLNEAGDPSPACVVVDLEGPLPEPEAIRAGSTTAVLVGVARGPLSPAACATASALDCSLVPAGADGGSALVAVADPAAAAAGLRRAIAHAPRAAMALAQLLRLTSAVPVADGLAAESAVYSMLLAGGEFARWLAGRPPPRPRDESGPAVRVTRRGDTLHVLIDRPRRHNALDRDVRDGLVDAFELALADESLLRVDLCGSGGSFCSGGDLAEFGTTDDVSSAHLIRLDRSIARRLDRCRDRVVAHIHGACIGAGIEIPSFAGRVLARPDTTIRLPELGMGLVPGAGGTVGLPRRIGRWRTAYLALSGAPLDVTTALGWGLVDAVDDD